MISKSLCLYGYILLYGGAIFTLFVRALLRRRLLREIAKHPGARGAGGNENWLKRMLLALPRDVAALRGLGKSIGEAPEPVRKRYRRFRALGWIAGTLIALLIAFSVTAHRFCGA